MTAPVLVDPAAPAPEAPPAQQQQRFKTLLVPFNTMSGDGRMIAEPAGGVRVRPLPQPLLYQEALDVAHDGAVVVGAFDTVYAEGGQLWGGGWFDMADGSGTAQEVVRRIDQGLINGISVDIDDVTSELRCTRDGEPVECPDPMLEIDMAVLDEIQFVDVATDWRFMNATIVSQPAFQEARIWLDNEIPAAGTEPEPVGEPEPSDEVVASLVADARAAVAEPDLWRPPAAWFADPAFDRVVPLQVAADGRVFGHVATWYDEAGRPSCHVGYPGTCKTVPHSVTGYRYFHTGVIDTDDGPLAVGTITLGCKHPRDRAGWAEACQFYADSGAGVAVGRSGEDEHGIWFAGARTPTATREQTYTLGRVTISPDWRDIGGNMEMVGLLGVNTGGFPQPRAAADGRRPLSLVAAGAIYRGTPASPYVDMEALAEAVEEVAARREVRAARARLLAAGVRRERARRLAAAVRRSA